MDHKTILKKLFASYPAAVQPETVAVYLEMLVEYDIDVVAWSVDEAIRTCKKLPSVADIREIATERKRIGTAWQPQNERLLPGGTPLRSVPYITSREEERKQLNKWNALNKRKQNTSGN